MTIYIKSNRKGSLPLRNKIRESRGTDVNTLSPGLRTKFNPAKRHRDHTASPEVNVGTVLMKPLPLRVAIKTKNTSPNTTDLDSAPQRICSGQGD